MGRLDVVSDNLVFVFDVVALDVANEPPERLLGLFVSTFGGKPD